MARDFIAILAILALAASPITASAAATGCDMGTSMAVAMAPMDEMLSDQPNASISPCGDTALRNCAATCASLCAGALAVLPAISTGATLVVQMAPKPGTVLPCMPIGHPHPIALQN